MNLYIVSEKHQPSDSMLWLEHLETLYIKKSVLKYSCILYKKVDEFIFQQIPYLSINFLIYSFCKHM